MGIVENKEVKFWDVSLTKEQLDLVEKIKSLPPPKMSPIKFYLGKKYLGVGYIGEHSFKEDRIKEARKLGITYYTGIIIGKRDLRGFKYFNRKSVDFPPMPPKNTKDWLKEIELKRELQRTRSVTLSGVDVNYKRKLKNK